MEEDMEGLELTDKRPTLTLTSLLIFPFIFPLILAFALRRERSLLADTEEVAEGDLEMLLLEGIGLRLER